MGSFRVLAVLSSVALTVFFSTPSRSETLVAGHADWMPWCSTAKTDGEGILIDIFKIACSRAGHRPETIPMPSKRRNEVEWGNTVNVELGVIPEWREAFKAVSVYTVPVFRTVNIVLCKKGRIPQTTTIDGFYGKVMGANLGYYYTDGFNEAFDQGRIRRDDSAEGAAIVKKLIHDRCDAIIVDRYEARYWLKKLGQDADGFDEAYVFKMVTDLRIRLHASKAPLLEGIDRALEAMKNDGSIQRIVDRYTR